MLQNGSQGFYDEVWKHLQVMIKIGAIWLSNSPWASAIVLLRKKNGKLNFCIYLRKLNSLTVKDAYSIPRIQDTGLPTRHNLVHSLGLKNRYWQVELEEASKALTAFTVGPLGFYRCEQIPFGLTNALTLFQCLMETCLGNLQFWWCIIYLDDVTIFMLPQEYLKRLCTVLSWLQVAGLKFKSTKCSLFGHNICKEGIQTNGHKVEAIKNWPVSIMVTELRSLLRFTNHYRCFIKGYAKVACPLYNQISGDNATHKKQKIQWMEECQEAFDALKSLGTSTQILAFADFTKPFKLHTNASTIGLGAVLYQEQDGKDRVIAFASKAPPRVNLITQHISWNS